MEKAAPTVELTEISALWHKLREAPTDAQSWLALVQRYAADGLSWQAEYAAVQAFRCDRNLQKTLAELVPGGGMSQSEGDRILADNKLPDAGQFISRFSRALEESSEDWITSLYLARLHEIQGNRDKAAEQIPAAQSCEVLPGETLHWIGLWRLRSGNPQGAIEALSALVDIRPVRFGSMMFLGEALMRLGQIEAAQKAFSRASMSANPGFLQVLAAKVFLLNYWQESIEILKKAVSLAPGDVDAWLSLAWTQEKSYRLADSLESKRRIAEIAPDHPQLPMLDAAVQTRLGNAEASLNVLLGEYGKGTRTHSRLVSTIAMTSLYCEGKSAAEKAELHRRLCGQIAKALVISKEIRVPVPKPLKNRRLRVGYVSGDLYRQHPVGLLIQPLLAKHDRKHFAIHIYNSGVLYDDQTQRIRQSADKWVDAANLSDRQLRDIILADEIDVLIDLSGHTEGHRLGLFAMRAAPVQASFLGYPHSTGLPGIDWLIADAIAIPEEHKNLCSERVARLPHSVFCWVPGEDYPLPAARPAGATLVFGSFNHIPKLTQKTVALWSRIMRELPESRLLLKAPSFSDDLARKRYEGLFAKNGIDSARLEFRGPSPLNDMMSEYGDIDIALDPTPYNGGMTTLQALWMGVPVISLAGDNFAGRMGASLLTTLGEEKWLATDEASYVKAALRLAKSTQEIRGGRARLRAQMEASPLVDIGQYTRHFQRLLVKLASGNNAVPFR